MKSRKQESLRVVIADDHEIVRKGLHEFLLGEQDGTFLFEVVAEPANGFDTLLAVKKYKPELLFLDLSMPRSGGSEIVPEVQRVSPETRILVYTALRSFGVLSNLIEQGVNAIFSKSMPMESMRKQLPLIIQGGRFIAPEFEDIVGKRSATRELTSRERQTLSMILSGKTNPEIAKIWSVSPKTVDNHRTRLMAKLNVHSAAQLMSLALEEGLVEQYSGFS